MENEEQSIGLTIHLPYLVADALIEGAKNLSVKTKKNQTPETVALGLIMSGLVQAKLISKKDLRKLGVKI